MALMTRPALYHRIDSMRGKYGIRGLFDPFAFAGERGIELRFHSFSTERLRGVLVFNGSYGVVLDSRLTDAERRYTLTHELVHFELHPGQNIHTFADSYEEYQADEGAAELLMPYRDFIPRAVFMRRRLLSDKSAALYSLAKFYGLDCEYIRRRLVSLDRELMLFLRGEPLSAISPQSRAGAADPEFLKTPQPIDPAAANIVYD